MNIVTKICCFLDKKYKVRLSILFVMMVVSAALEVVGIGLVFPFISIINNPNIIQQQRAFVWLYDFFGMSSSRQFILWSIFAFLVINILKNLYLALFNFTQYRFCCGLEHFLSNRLIKAYLYAPYTFHLQRNSAQLLQNATQEVFKTCCNVVVPGITMISELVVVAVVFALLAIIVSPMAAFVTALILGIVAFLFAKTFNKKLSRLGLELQRHNGKMIQWIQQGLDGIKETKILGRETFFLNAYAKHSIGYTGAYAFILGMYQLPRLITDFLAISGMMLLICVSLLMGGDLQAVTPLLALFAMAALRLMPSGNRLMGTWTMIQANAPAVDVVYNDLREVEKFEPRTLQQPSLIDGAEPVYSGEIEICNLSYKYPSSNRNAINDISVKISPHTSIAFVGPSGAGKSTLLDVLLGLLLPDQGDILSGGQSIYTNLSAWQRKFGYIPQTIFLADDSIRRNVALGLEDDQIREEKVWRALKMVHMDGFVKELPQKLDTFVGEGGVRLSGGQRQRIGIARALYYDPDILVLDEATSSLDHEVEKEIMWAIDNLGGKKTIIIVAHRLTTVKNCDHIYLLRNGKLISRVQYDELLDKGFREYESSEASVC